MQKITFQDTTVLKKPYIDFNGIEYEVQDGSYDGGTDLNASTFNTMQNNIETAINSIVKNDNIRSYGSVETNQTYILNTGKKFDDYKIIEIRTDKKSFMFTLNAFINHPIEIEYFENITSDTTKIVIEIEYVGNTSFKCNRSGYVGYGASYISDNPYNIELFGVM